MLNIVLVEPEIPYNTGNVARTCAATGTRLHLVKPFGFDLSDKHLKRAGLDYWSMLDIVIYENLEDFFQKNLGKKFYFASSKSKHNYTEVQYAEDDFILFGRETRGLEESLLHENYDSCVRIPMIEGARCLNLSNSVAVILYEALRQRGFSEMKEDGELIRFP